MVCVTGTMSLNDPKLARTRSITPNWVCSMVSFSSPSWDEGKTSMQMRPWDFSLASAAMALTPSTVG